MRPSPDPEHDAEPDQEPGRVGQLQMSGQYSLQFTSSDADHGQATNGFGQKI